VRGMLAVSLMLLAWAPAGAGELIFTNGSQIAGELSSESLMVSTGSGLVEVASEDVVSLARDEVALRDGRVIRGTLVGGQIKARTSLGEIAVKVDELQSYRGDAQEAGSAQPAASRPASAGAPATASPTPTAVSSAQSNTGIAGGLPTMAAYQDSSPARQSSGAQTAVLTPGSPSTSATRMFEVVGESVVYRDALYSSSRVGRVVSGQQVRYVDSIDRRLRILNVLVFDGGNWVRIRVPDGTEGWVPADAVREVR
jgi:hypothetical protein